MRYKESEKKEPKGSFFINCNLLPIVKIHILQQIFESFSLLIKESHFFLYRVRQRKQLHL
jgi:hypothetical protein